MFLPAHPPACPHFRQSEVSKFVVCCMSVLVFFDTHGIRDGGRIHSISTEVQTVGCHYLLMHRLETLCIILTVHLIRPQQVAVVCCEYVYNLLLLYKCRCLQSSKHTYIHTCVVCE